MQQEPGKLSSNFIVYNNDKNKLVSEIKRIKNSYDPKVVVNTFRKYHHQLFYGDKNALQKFIEKIRNKEINSKFHNSYL